MTVYVAITEVNVLALDRSTYMAVNGQHPRPNAFVIIGTQCYSYIVNVEDRIPQPSSYHRLGDLHPPKEMLSQFAWYSYISHLAIKQWQNCSKRF